MDKTAGGHGQKKAKAIVIIAVVVVLAAGVGVGLRWWQQRENDQQAAEPDAIAEVTTEAQNQVFAGNYDQAHETINKALDNPSLSDQAKIDLYVQQGAAYESQQDYNAALESFRQAEALDPESYGVALSIANVATLMKNKELAIEYYKKALALFPEDEDDPLRDQNRQYIEDWIAIWEAGGPEDGPEGNE